MHAIAHVEAAPAYVAPVEAAPGHATPANAAPPHATRTPPARAQPASPYPPRSTAPPPYSPVQYTPRPYAPAQYAPRPYAPVQYTPRSYAPPARSYPPPAYPPRSYTVQPYAAPPYGVRPVPVAPYAAYPYAAHPYAAAYAAPPSYYAAPYYYGYGPAYAPALREGAVVAPQPYQARPGLQVGVRAGYLAGLGVVYSGLAFGDMSAGAVPLLVDVGWRFMPEIYVGAYGQVAPLVMRTGTDSCPDGTDCSGLNWRVGLELDYHFVPSSRLDPYVGIGAGYEILHRTINGPITVPGSSSPAPTTSTPTTTSSSGTKPTSTTRTGMLDTSVTDQGWEMAAVTLGFDVRLSSGMGIGPFATGTLGRYGIHSGTQSTVLNGGTVTSGSVSAVDHDVHQLLIVGVRGSFNP